MLELEALELVVLELEVLELEALVLALEVLELEVLALEALELKALELEALELEALELEALDLVAMCSSVSPSHHSSCASGLPGAPAFGVAQELEALELEVLALEVLELEVLALEALALEALELEVLELEALALEALELEVLELEALELEALELETLELEELVLGVLALETLMLEVMALSLLELEALELGVLALEVLELETLAIEELVLEVLALETLALEVLELEVLELEALEQEALCSSDHFSCNRRSCPSFHPKRREPASRPASPACSSCPAFASSYCARYSHYGTQHLPLPSPPASSLLYVPDPESDRVRAASPTVTRLSATVVTDPPLESAVASALVVELVDFAAVCRLDYTASLVAESESVCPPSVWGELHAPEGDPDALNIPTPRSYAEAISGPYSSQWQTAMDAEMASWKSTGTYVDEVPPPGANIVDGMEIFKTFSPTPKMTTLWVLLHVAAQRDYELHSLDFSTAFLQGSLHEEIWLRCPPGFTGSFPPGSQWSLRRPVYGLRQAPREWYDTLRTTLAALGFAPSTADPSLFLRTDTSLPPFYILVYVDDLAFATAYTEALGVVKSRLQKRHTCTDLGELRSYLGLQITRDRARRTITLTQSHMVEQVLQRFGFQFSSPQSTPLPTGHSLSAPPSDESVEPSGPYPELVGCLIYLMTCTRPDLAYPLSILARYVAPGRHRREHWEAAKRVLRYLCSTSGMGLVLGGRGRVVLTGHSDASWVDDLATQRSSQGYTFSLGSGSVSWRSTRSSSVLSSSCEAEIYAGAMVSQKLRWLTYLLTDLGERPSVLQFCLVPTFSHLLTS
ncbi:unnamed protein product [Closterium sp. Yama58-4]|nr:unnamed protein product [Closterium sp. Yama58-4]